MNTASRALRTGTMAMALRARAGLPLLLAIGLLPATAGAQDSAPEPFDAPVAGSWETVRSMGQPPRWRPAIGLAFGLDRIEGAIRPGPTISGGMHRDLLNPVTGALGVSAYGYLGQRARELDGGLRFFLDSPAFFLHAGVDWNPRDGRVRPVFSTTFPVRRGGWFDRGDVVRLDVLPGRDPRVAAGVSLPFRQRFSGRARSRSISVRLPDPPPAGGAVSDATDPTVRELVQELERSMSWIGALHNIYWLTERKGIASSERVLRLRQILEILRAELAEREALLPEPATYAREVEHYHRALERAFALAAGDRFPVGLDGGGSLAARARAMVLEEVVLPYNRTVGQFRNPDTLDGLAVRARARFAGWLAAEAGLAGENGEQVLRVFDAWLQALERERRELRGWTGDGRMQWIPLALVLRAEDHDTGGKVDALVELALRQPFTGGNATLLMGATQFQEELLRTLRETRSYHVLWIHDFRGRDGTGSPDRTGYVQTAEGYLQSLIENVREYDRTGRLPVYIIILDQFFYEENDGRLWMDLLERPLTHRVRLPAGFDDMAGSLGSLQESLRQAVSESRRLQAQARISGSGWIEEVVKVHVNITNQSDFSFRTRRLLGLPMGSDNLIRDHRKIVIRDVTGADPAAGEVLLTGAGVGDHYASTTWDDKALLIQGPAALAARDAAREVLERNGVAPDEVPLPLRSAPLAADYAARVRELEASGATARVLQVHNRTGWGQKDATFVQMLLYDLAPPGTVIYVPDSLWTSPEWMAQLVSAALRGCRVLIVAPALANAAAPGFPMMSETRELLVALVLVREALGDVIREAGGDLHVGLYTRRSPMDDLPARLNEVRAAFQSSPFLHDLFPLHPDAWEAVGRHSNMPVASAPDAAVVLTDRDDGRPKLHQKTQFIVSGALLEALSRDPRSAGVLDSYLQHEREGIAESWGSGPIMGRASMQPMHRLLALERGLPAHMRHDAMAYLMVGSLNKNVRSMALDGEAMGVISGPWALKGFIDFLLLSGSVTWVDTPEQIDQLIPPYSNLRRLLGRFMFRIL